MELNEMTKADVEARLAELDEEVEKAEEVEAIDAATEEKRSLMERKAELEDVEQRMADAAALDENEVEPEKIIEIEEEKVMENRTFAVDSVEYRDAYMKNLMGIELDAEERAAVSASSVIPQITVDKIAGKMKDYPLLDAVDVLHLPGTVVIPVRGTVNSAAIVAMGSAASDSEDTVTSISLSTYKLIKTLEITADLKAMSIPAFEGWLVENLVNQIYRAAQTLAITGDGTSTLTGLSQRTADGTYASTGMTYTNLMGIIAELPGEYSQGANFVMSRNSFYKGVLNIQDTNKKPVVVADPQSPAKFNILGYPVILVDACNDDVYFGDLKEAYKLNFGEGVKVDRDESVGFRTGSTCFRGMALCDGKPTGIGVVRFTKATV